MTDILDTKITEMLAQVKTKREALSKLESELKGSWKTSCSLTIGGTHYSIQTLKSEQVVEVVTALIKEQFFVEKAIEVLGVTYNPKFSNFPINDWIDDCKKRLKTIDFKNQKDQLDKMDEKLNKLVSPEKRRQMEIDMIAEQLGSI